MIGRHPLYGHLTPEYIGIYKKRRYTSLDITRLRQYHSQSQLGMNVMLDIHNCDRYRKVEVILSIDKLGPSWTGQDVLRPMDIIDRA